jgi:predicted transposase/invertase (TIGR01784 family)
MLAERVNKWIAEYKAEGKAEGKAEAKAEGRLEERVSILKRMKKAGLSVSDMSQITGLSEDEIRHII